MDIGKIGYKIMLIVMCVLLVIAFIAFCIVTRGEEIEKESADDEGGKGFFKISDAEFSRIINKHYSHLYKEDNGLETLYYDRDLYFDVFDSSGVKEIVILKEVYDLHDDKVCYYLNKEYKRLRGKISRW